MARTLRVGSAVLLAVILSACSARASAPQSVILDDFERVPATGQLGGAFDPIEAIKHPTYPASDFDVETAGYASVTSISKQSARAANDKSLYLFIQGNSAAQVRFTVPGDYHQKGEDDYPQTWETGFGLSTSSLTPLKVTDWSSYRYFDFRVYNPEKAPQVLHIRYSDANSNLTATAVTLPAGECEVELPLDQLAQARLDPSDIKEVLLYLDTDSQDTDPVLMFDQLALYETDAATRAKIEAAGGEEDDQDQEDWDSEDEDVVRKVRVVHPGDALPASGASSAAPVSPVAATVPGL